MPKSPWEVDIDTLVADRQAFNSFVYTPLDEALKELKKRRQDVKLAEKIREFLHNDIPSFLKRLPTRAVLFRQVVTPNYEVRRFFHITQGLDDLEPLFWEYHEDKFTSNNDWKRSLGKLTFLMGIGKKEGKKIESATIINFNTYNGKKISQVKTLWGQSLVKFHHELFDKTYRTSSQKHFFDSSKWFKRNGATANEYYLPFFLLFIQHAVLFENFMLDTKELSFSRDVFLPAFIRAFKETGYKPLIVALEPTDIEGDNYWLYHPGKSKSFVESKSANTFFSRPLLSIQEYIERLPYIYRKYGHKQLF